METNLASSNPQSAIPFFEQGLGSTLKQARPSASEDSRFPPLKVVAERALIRLSDTAALAPLSQYRSLMELSPCVDRADIIAAGLNLSGDVLEAAVRFPRLVYDGLVDSLPALIASGLAEEVPCTAQNGASTASAEIRADDWVCRLYGTALALLFLKAEVCQDLTDFTYLAEIFFSDLGTLLENDAIFTAAFDEFVADRHCGQYWIMDGVEHCALYGPKRATVELDRYGLGYQVCALTAEQRHRLLCRYRKTRCLAAVQNDALLWSVRHRDDSRRPAFHTPAEIDDLLPWAIAKDQLFAAVLWLSDFAPSVDLPVPATPRDIECQSDIRFAMRLVKFRPAQPRAEESLLVNKAQTVARDWFWHHGKDWRQQADEIYEYICDSLNRAWVRWLRTATFERDSEAGLGRKDGWSQIEDTFPDCDLREIDESTYRRSHDEIEKARKWTVATTEENKEGPLRTRLARSLSGAGFDSVAMVETDIQRAFEALYGRRVSAEERDWYPLPAVKDLGVGIPAPRIDRKRPALDSASRRDLEIFTMRYLEGFGRKDLTTFAGKRSVFQGGATFAPARRLRFKGTRYGYGPAPFSEFMGISPRAAAAGWRNVSPDRRGREVVRWLLENGYNRADLGRLAPGILGILGEEPEAIENAG